MTALLARPDRTAERPGAWRRLFGRCLLVPLVVTAPLSYLALGSDHRYNIYWHGSVVLARPWRLITENIRTVPMYLDFGNFRPLGRMLEWALDAFAYALTELLQIPAQVSLRIVAALAAAVLTAAAVLLAEAVTARGRMFAGPPARAITLIPYAIGGCLVAAGALSSTVLFGGLYFLCAALVLAVAAWVARGPAPAPLLVLAGAGIALVNEMAALAVPLATAVVLIRRRPRRRAALLWAGFLPVFVPIRLLLYAACRDGDCYGNSDLVLGPRIAIALPNRLASWLPPLQWGEAVRGAEPPGLLVVAAAIVILGLLAVRLFTELPTLPALNRRQATDLALTGAAVVLLGALLGSLNRQGQAAAELGRWGNGWRDSAVTAAGAGLLVAGLLALLTRAVAHRIAPVARGVGLQVGPLARGVVPRVALIARGVVLRVAAVAPGTGHRAALVVLVLTAAASTAANHAFARQANRTAPALVTSAIAGEIAQFDPTPAGNARRCALRDRFAEIFDGGRYSRFGRGELPRTTSIPDRMTVTADMATQRMYGTPFCRESPR